MAEEVHSFAYAVVVAEHCVETGELFLEFLGGSWRIGDAHYGAGLSPLAHECVGAAGDWAAPDQVCTEECFGECDVDPSQ